MADIDKEKDKQKGEEVKEEVKSMRITLSSTNVKSLEETCATLLANAKAKQLKMTGPVRMPTKVLKITTRMTPCGEGSKTWDRYQMRIHKRVLDVKCSINAMQEITKFKIDPKMFIDIKQH